MLDRFETVQSALGATFGATRRSNVDERGMPRWRAGASEKKLSTPSAKQGGLPLSSASFWESSWSHYVCRGVTATRSVIRLGDVLR
jgi:hypothetical protein